MSYDLPQSEMIPGLLWGAFHQVHTFRSLRRKAAARWAAAPTGATPPRDAKREKPPHVEIGPDIPEGAQVAALNTPETDTRMTGTDNHGRAGPMHPVTIPPMMAGMKDPAGATNKNIGILWHKPIKQGGIKEIDGRSRSSTIRTDTQVGGTKNNTTTEISTHELRFQHHHLQQNRHRTVGQQKTHKRDTEDQSTLAADQQHMYIHSMTGPCILGLIAL